MRQRAFLLSLTAAVAALTSGCGAGESSAPSDEQTHHNPSLADVIYEGKVNEAQLEALLAIAPAKTDPNRGAAIDAPSNDALLPPDRVATFQWHARGEAVSASGLAYFLKFSTDVDPKLLRVFTDKSSYTPSATAWAKLKGARSWTTFGLLTATLAGDKVPEDGGPYTGDVIEFCIEQP